MDISKDVCCKHEGLWNKKLLYKDDFLGVVLPVLTTRILKFTLFM